MDQIFKAFSDWLNPLLTDNDFSDSVAFCFNLYEGDESFHVQLVATSSYDEEDPDWACDEVYTSEENIFILQESVTGDSWEEGLAFSKKMAEKYLNEGAQSSVLKSKTAVAIGFVDGDLEIIFKA